MEFRPITDQEKSDINQYLKIDIKELQDEVLGRYVEVDHSWDISAFEDDITLSDGKQKVPLGTIVKVKLCNDWQLCSKLEFLSNSSEYDIIVAIGDGLITTSLQLPIPVLLVATAVFKIGIRRFCDCNVSDSSKS